MQEASREDLHPGRRCAAVDIQLLARQEQYLEAMETKRMSISQRSVHGQEIEVCAVRIVKLLR
jgi:hypothetical protein